MAGGSHFHRTYYPFTQITRIGLRIVLSRIIIFKRLTDPQVFENPPVSLPI
jgi:hypothetical protein